MVGSLLSAANWPIVGQICWVLGKVMNFIYTMLDGALPSDTGLVGISIILYTILVYTLMLPMTINQQRSSKMQAVVQPEVMAIQKKYKNKKDQASMLKQQEQAKKGGRADYNAETEGMSKSERNKYNRELINEARKRMAEKYGDEYREDDSE